MKTNAETNKGVAEQKKPMSDADKIAAQSKIIKNLTLELDEATKLAADATEMLKDADTLAAEVGSKIEDKTKEAVDDSTAVSEDVKDGIVETMSKIDPELSAELTEEFAKADLNEEEITGEKFAATVNKVLDKYATRLNIRGGLTRNKPASDKTASATGNGFNDKLAEELSQL